MCSDFIIFVHIFFVIKFYNLLFKTIFENIYYLKNITFFICLSIKNLNFHNNKISKYKLQNLRYDKGRSRINISKPQNL